MSKTRNISDLLDANGDVKATALDNVPASNDASALTTGTLPNARLSSVPNSALANSSITINGSATSLGGSATINTDLSNDSTPQLGGDLSSNGNDILMADNDKIKLGTGNDLEIYHDGSNSIIKDAGTGNINILADDFKVMNSSGTENIIFGAEDGTARLFHNNVTRLETTGSGITVTGGDFRTAIFQRSGTGAFISLNDSTTTATDAVLIGATGDDLVFHTGNTEKARLNSSGTLTATAFSGDGSSLTNLPASTPSDGSITFAKLSGSSTESINVQKRIAKVWVNFNASSDSIRQDYNVSSITNVTTGRNRINFTSSLADTNYCCSGMAQVSSNDGGICMVAYTSDYHGSAVATSSVRVDTTTAENSSNDAPICCVTIMR